MCPAVGEEFVDEALHYANKLLAAAVEDTSQPKVALASFILSAARLAHMMAELGQPTIARPPFHQPDARESFVLLCTAAFDNEVERARVG